MSYATTRRLVLAAGLALLLLIAGVMYVRRVDTVEVIAVLLFIPVFLAFSFWKVIGGAVAGIAATAIYAALRAPAIDAVGGGRYIGIIAGRGLGYLAFGLLGGWASQQLERSLQKLDVYDQVDDDTGLFNARFLVQDIGLEMARATRYQTFFSVCMVEVPAAPLESLARRARTSLLKDLGHQMKEAVRTVDRPVHAKDSARPPLRRHLPRDRGGRCPHLRQPPGRPDRRVRQGSRRRPPGGSADVVVGHVSRRRHDDGCPERAVRGD